MFVPRIYQKIFKFRSAVSPVLVKKVHGKFNGKADVCKEGNDPVKVVYDVYEKRPSEGNNKNAPPLIILDGILGSKNNWARYSKIGRQETNPPREIIAVETRNHGKSPDSKFHRYEDMAADLRYLMADRNLNKCSLLGFSVGGRAAMMFSLLYPELVEKLLVVEVSPISVSPEIIRKGKELMEAMMKVSVPRNLSLKEAQLYANEKMKDAIKNDKLRSQYVVEFLSKGENGEYRWGFNLPSLHDNIENMLNFRIPKNKRFIGPTLFIIAEKSDFVPKCDRPQILELFPKAEFKVIKGASHFVQLEKPEEFRHHSIEFFNNK